MEDYEYFEDTKEDEFDEILSGKIDLILEDKCKNEATTLQVRKKDEKAPVVSQSSTDFNVSSSTSFVA